MLIVYAGCFLLRRDHPATCSLGRIVDRVAAPAWFPTTATGSFPYKLAKSMPTAAPIVGEITMRCM